MNNTMLNLPSLDTYANSLGTTIGTLAETKTHNALDDLVEELKMDS